MRAPKGLRGNPDLAAATAGVVVGLAITSLNHIYSNEYLLTMGPLLVLASVLYLLFRRRIEVSEKQPQSSSDRLPTIAHVIYWIALGLSVYSLTLEPLHRPTSYFLLTALCASMVALQTASMPGKRGIPMVLFMILLLSLTVRASAFWVFPTIPGVDSWSHMAIAEEIATHGHVVSELENGSLNAYYTMPVMHLNVAFTSLVAGVDGKTAMYVGCALPATLSILFVFLIGQRVAGDKAGLLAALLIGLSDYHIQHTSQSIIAMSTAFVPFIAVIWLLACQPQPTRDARSALLVLLFMATLIATHTVASFIMFFTLVALLVAPLYHRSRSSLAGRPGGALRPELLAIFGMAVFVHWSVSSYGGPGGSSFFENRLLSFLRSLTTEAEVLVSRPPSSIAQYGLVEPILDISGYLLLLFFGILGALLWLSWRDQQTIRVSLIAALLTMMGIQFFFPVLGLRDILPSRWFAFYYPILGVLAASGLLATSNLFNWRPLKTGFLASLVFAVTLLMTTNSIANTDSPIYGRQFSTPLAYTESEMAAARLVGGVFDGLIVADRRYGGTVLGEYLNLSNRWSLEMLSEQQQRAGIVMWRETFSHRAADFMDSRTRQILVLGDNYAIQLAGRQQAVYQNRSVTAFLGSVSDSLKGTHPHEWRDD